MKENVSEGEFIDRFRQMNRENNFSYEGRKALYDYFLQLEEDIGEEIEFDCIAICCEYNEYEDIKEFWVDYDKDSYPDIESISDNTTVIMIDDDSFIIQAF